MRRFLRIAGIVIGTIVTIALVALVFLLQGPSRSRSFGLSARSRAAAKTRRPTGGGAAGQDQRRRSGEVEPARRSLSRRRPLRSA